LRSHGIARPPSMGSPHTATARKLAIKTPAIGTKVHRPIGAWRSTSAGLNLLARGGRGVPTGRPSASQTLSPPQ